MKIEKLVRELIETLDLEICIHFRKENQGQIKKSRIKLSRDEELIEELIEMEKEEAERMRQEVLQEQQQVESFVWPLMVRPGYLRNQSVQITDLSKLI